MLNETPVVVDLYASMHQSLITVHRALAAEFAALLAIDRTDRAGLVAAAGGAGGFLLGHHHFESTLAFPALRRAGILRSTDVAFLEGLDREHHALHEICERLVGEAQAPHPRGEELLVLGKEIATAFGLHIRGEEAGLAPDRLRTMITVEGLTELQREQEAMHAAHAARVAHAAGT